MLEQTMIFKTIMCFQLSGRDFLFQHDNASMHKVKPIKKCFSKLGMEDVNWPAQSPIQHLWVELDGDF